MHNKLVEKNAIEFSVKSKEISLKKGILITKLGGHLKLKESWEGRRRKLAVEDDGTKKCAGKGRFQTFWSLITI